MIEPHAIINALAVDRERVLDFFAYFSRFEYSLKRSGFLRPGAKAEPDWDAFANSLRGRFAGVQDADFRDAVAFLRREPPKTQVVSGNDLGWTETIPGNGEQDESYVLRLVRTVRNNLFHGGKYPYPAGPMVEVARNRRLLEAAITVLGQCLELSTAVRGAFEEAA
jgi:hypothetical protein